MGTSKRRTAAQWQQEVERWRESGETADAYGQANGLSVTSLRWWSWKLGPKKARKGIGKPTKQTEGIKLVSVDVVEDGQRAAPRNGVRWELRTAQGDELLGYEALSVERLGIIVRALLSRGER